MIVPLPWTPARPAKATAPVGEPVLDAVLGTVEAAGELVVAGGALFAVHPFVLLAAIGMTLDGLRRAARPGHPET